MVSRQILLRFGKAPRRGREHSHSINHFVTNSFRKPPPRPNTQIGHWQKFLAGGGNNLPSNMHTEKRVGELGSGGGGGGQTANGFMFEIIN